MKETKKSTAELEKAFRYFMLNGELHKLVKVWARTNTAKCYNYNRRQFVSYFWSDIQRHAGKTYSISDAVRITGVSRNTILRYEAAGRVTPQRAWDFGWDEKSNSAEVGGPGEKRRYTEENLYDIVEESLARYGNSKRRISIKELERRLKRGRREIYYVDENGELRPLWKRLSW